MSILLEPSTQLGFNRPLTQVVKKSLIVRNTNPQPVAFKVKTTAPKLYCVRPNSGRVEPGESVEVSVILQPMKEEPPVSMKCKDKFLVQSTFITPEKESLPLPDIWAAAKNESVHQQKIKVVYLPPGVDSIPENEGFTQSMMTEGESQFNTVRPTPMNGHPNVINTFVPIHKDGRHHLTASPPQERSVSPAHGEYIIAHEETTHQENQYGSVPPSPIHQSHRTHSPPNSELVVKYSEAQEEIGRLKALVASLSKASQSRASAAASSVASGMRRRRTSGPLSDDGSYIGESVDGETIVDHSVSSTESGVPLQIVVIIALGVFVTTYLFF